jgi:hypothetical protein
MDCQQVVRRGVFLLATMAVVAVLVVFKVRVAVAGGKYILALLVILFLVWLVSRSGRR